MKRMSLMKFCKGGIQPILTGENGEVFNSIEEVGQSHVRQDN